MGLHEKRHTERKDENRVTPTVRRLSALTRRTDEALAEQRKMRDSTFSKFYVRQQSTLQIHVSNH